MPVEATHHSFVIDAAGAGLRLDAYLALRIKDHSRAALQSLIKDGHVTLNDRPAKAAARLRPGDRLEVIIPPPAPTGLAPEPVSFSILYQDGDIVVLGKPPGLVVHPAAGHATGTLVHGLLHACGDLAGVGGELRPGIVHRLDRDTSGIMIVAKNDPAHRALVAQFKERRIAKTYLALVAGVPRETSGLVDAPIGRHPVNRKKMAVRPDGRPAQTAWRVRRAFAACALLEARPRTGRTHQIRVHLASLGHPIVGDPVYGRRTSPIPDCPAERLCLHALRLEFRHPRTGEQMRFTAPLWPDFTAVLRCLAGLEPLS